MSAPILLVGYRFAVTEFLVECRVGIESVVMEAEPISGPVYLCEGAAYTAGDAFETASKSKRFWFAHCRGCDEMSESYKKKGSMQIRQWAHHHRCEQRLGITMGGRKL